MTTRRRRAATGALIAPVLLFASILSIVIVVGSTPPVPDAQTPGMPTDAPPVPPDRETECLRGQHGAQEVVERSPAEGERVTSSLVVACPAAFDGRRVTYSGELIGEFLQRDGGAWVLVNDDDYALMLGPLTRHREYRGTNSGLSVWLPDHLTGRITGFGRPNQRGDLVRIEGRIVRTDPHDGGGLTLRASDLEVLGSAQTFEEPLLVPQALLAVGSLVIAAMIAIRRRRM